MVRAPRPTRRARPAPADRIHVVDSHTEGEPTRVVTAGGPNLGPGGIQRQLRAFEERFDWFRGVVLDEPRGSPTSVGALLLPSHRDVAASVAFFNNVGYLGMCGHGTIGVLATLAYLGKVSVPGSYRIETVVGRVRAAIHDAHSVTVENVPSFRFRAGVPLDVPGYGRLHGDVAWGGNWFFLIDESPVPVERRRILELSDLAFRVKEAVRSAGVAGREGAPIDHIELSGAPERPDADSKNFVLCPGGEYDRSPCGTGTSAKMACLHADGRLAEGVPFRQESILGTIFEGRVRARGAEVIPSITGSAYITGEGDLMIDPEDPLAPVHR